mgnify:CR=1 FL=1
MVFRSIRDASGRLVGALPLYQHEFDALVEAYTEDCDGDVCYWGVKENGVVVAEGNCRHYKEAREAAERVALAQPLLQSLRHRSQQVIADLHLRGLLALLGEDERVRLFVERELGPLERHDRADGSRTDLLAALRALLLHPASKTEAAASLHLSRAAFYDRLARIEAVLDADLDDPDVRVSLHVALVARDLGDELSGGPGK